jgi:hypothetical protein
VFGEHAFEFNGDLYDYRRGHPDQPRPGAGPTGRHWRSSACSDGYVDHPIVLADLLVVA